MDDRVIFLVDIQSFYASVEQAERPELRGRPLVVAGDPERPTSIVLAASPQAKAYGVKTAERLWQAQRKCPDLIVVAPRMQRYLDVSLQITDILERFTDLVEPYSIDEQFLDVTGSRTLFGPPPVMAKRIQRAIRDETGTYARIGIGPNKVLAKMACDNFAKRNRSGVFWLTRDRLADTLWPLPIEAMFGVGGRMARHLRRMGIRTIGALANHPLGNLQARWGINGHVLWMTANGIDYSPVSPATHERQKAIGHNMTLPRDYRRADEVRVVLLELCEEVCRRARELGMAGQTVSVGASGPAHDPLQRPYGFHRQLTLAEPTNATMELFAAAWYLFLRYWGGWPVRRVGVALTKLQHDQHPQLALLSDRVKQQRLGTTMDAIKQRYGADALLRAVSLTAAGQARHRARTIGGHYR